MPSQRSVVPHSAEELFPWLFGRLGIDPSSVTASPSARARRPIVGASATTPQKLWELFRIIDVVVAYTAAINRGRAQRGKRPLPFAGIDLSAGCWAYLNPADPTGGQPLIGSPGQLLEALVRHNVPYQLALCEQNDQVLKLLRTYLSTSTQHLGSNVRQVSVLEGSYGQLAIPWIEHNVRPWMPGLMIVDVNDVFDSPQLRAIAQCPELNHVDIALNLPVAMSKWPKRRVPPATVDEVQAAFGKHYWQYANPRGKYQWMWWYGTNNPKMRVLGERAFVDWKSQAGQARRDRVATTRAMWEHRGQLSLGEGFGGPTDG